MQMLPTQFSLCIDILHDHFPYYLQQVFFFFILTHANGRLVLLLKSTTRHGESHEIMEPWGTVDKETTPSCFPSWANRRKVIGAINSSNRSRGIFNAGRKVGALRISPHDGWCKKENLMSEHGTHTHMRKYRRHQEANPSQTRA